MSAPFRFQLALQGGGAKIVHLLAAVQGIEEACSTLGLNLNRNLTRLAGTSAGSILCGLLSTGATAEQLQSLVHSIPRKKSFPKPRKRRALPRILINHPIANFNPVIHAIHQALKSTKACDTDNKVLIKKCIFIPYSKFGPQEGAHYYFKQGEQIPHTDFLNAIQDSCALPFYYHTRTKNSSTSKLDGGLSNNLPTDLLISETNNFGPVFAISFKSSVNPKINSIMDYLLQVINIAIDSNTEKNKSPNKNVYIHEIDPDEISTFDFQQAFEELNSKNSNFIARVREEARQSFLDFYHKYNLYNNKQILHHWFWNYDNPHETTLADIYDTNHRPHKLNIINKTVEFALNSLNNKTKTDYILEKIKFKVVDQPLEFFRLDSFDLNLFRTKIEIHCTNKEEYGAINFKCLPTWRKITPPWPNDARTEITERGILIAFTPPINPDPDNIYEIRASIELEEVLPELSSGERMEDELIIGSERAMQSIKQLTIITSMLPDCDNYELLPSDDERYHTIQNLTHDQLVKSTGHEPYSPSHIVKAWAGFDVPAEKDICLKIRRVTRSI